MPRSKRTADPSAQSYTHDREKALLRPDAGAQLHFRDKRPPAEYRYDPTLDPELAWDISDTRDRLEALLADLEKCSGRLKDEAATDTEVELAAEIHRTARLLRSASSPFLNWAGKAENNAPQVPTLPLFVHERFSAKAIIETLRSHRRDKQLDLFADVELDLTDRFLQAYEHAVPWSNRLLLGDSLLVMNSLLHYEHLAGKVQMLYFDPPYGVQYNSNFQPFVRSRTVKHGDDQSLTREPEMVKAYRDTWSLGIHSYLTYLRDRLRLAWELLHSSGSIFVQISDENVHLVRCLLDEVFGAENFIVEIVFQKKGSQSGDFVPPINEYLIWYSKNKETAKFNNLYIPRDLAGAGGSGFDYVELEDGSIRKLEDDEAEGILELPKGARAFRYNPLFSAKTGPNEPVEIDGKKFPSGGNSWKISPLNVPKLYKAGRVVAQKSRLVFKRYADDFNFISFSNLWTGIGGAVNKEYVVQTNVEVIRRCLLMTTDPGDLVMDITCGSGTTAFVAEQWGRRWISCDISRVPLAIARQRLLTAVFPWYELKNPAEGVGGGFKYERKRNKKGEETGGIVPHVTLESLANDLLPKEEVLVDKPNVQSGITRVCGPFTVESINPPPLQLDAPAPAAPAEAGDYFHRMQEALRLSPVFRLRGNQLIELKTVKPLSRSPHLHAEAVQLIGGEEKPVAVVFGPESGALTERQVTDALREASLKSYAHVYFVAFARQPAADKAAGQAARLWEGLAATCVDASMDLQMGDLLKTNRASQVFSIAGTASVRLLRLRQKTEDGQPLHRVELEGLDVFDPVTMEVSHYEAEEKVEESVPAWFLDTDYNEMCFYARQAFFPKTKAWDNLRRELKGVFEDSVWEHLGGTASVPFVLGEQGRVAVKVVDPRGNEILVVKTAAEAVQEK